MDAWGLASEAAVWLGGGIGQVGSGQMGLVADRDLGSSPGQSAPGLALTERTEGSEAARISYLPAGAGPSPLPSLFHFDVCGFRFKKSEKREVRAATLPHTLAFKFLTLCQKYG